LYVDNETLNNLFFKFFQIIIYQREIFGPITSITFSIRTSDEIFKITNVAKRTQRTYIKKNHDGVELIDKKRKTGMWNQGNSKVTEDYLNKLKSKLEYQNDLTVAELRSQLLLET
jgi:hypothetical protein